MKKLKNKPLIYTIFKIKTPNKYRKGANFVRLFLLLFLVPIVSFGQLKLNYTGTFNVFDHSQINGKLTVDVTNTSNTLIDTLEWVIWPNAYKPSGTALGDEMLEDQSAAMRFAKPEDLGHFLINEIITKSETNQNKITFSREAERTAEVLKTAVNIEPGQTVQVVFNAIIKLPNAKFNGFGVDDNSIRLTQWLPKISADSAHATLNNKSRVAYFLPATFNLDFNFFTPYHTASNLTAQKSDFHYRFTSNSEVDDAAIILYKNASHYQLEGITDEVTMKFHGIFPPFNQTVSWQNVTQFLQRELDILPPQKATLAFLPDNLLPSTGNLFLLNPKLPQDELEGDLVGQLVQVYLREKLHINPAVHPWLTEGLSNYYKHLYFIEYYPEKRLVGPFAETFVAKFFDIDHYPISQQNRMAFLYMARQGLDQALNEPLENYSRANQGAIVRGKAALVFGYVRSYLGDKNFKRSMHRWMKNTQTNNTPNDFLKNIAYFSNKPTDWILGDLYTTNKKLDYKLKRTENCTSVYTATVKNKGHLVVPFSLTGIKDSVEVLTEWYPGHEKKITRQLHFEDYTKVTLDIDENMPEVSQKNNTVRTTGLFKNVKPLKLQFYTSFENPKKTQIFWLPSLKFNAYDKLLIGAQFYNTNLFVKPFEYLIAPDYSTGTGQLTGIASFKFNFTPQSAIFHRISFGMYARYYHYAENLAYTRLSPTLTFYLRKKHARSPWNNTIRLRSVSVDREVPANYDATAPGAQSPNYQVFDAQWLTEKGTLLTPFVGKADIQLADKFYKFTVSATQRWRLSKNHLFTGRIFAGFTNASNPYFQLGVSGTTDYLFDYYLIGRSDPTGLWSQQFFTTDGGFKSATNLMSKSILAANVNVPIFRFMGVFGDVAVYGANNQLAWDYGLYLEFIPDFFEIYFPFQNNNTNFIAQPNYQENIRFVLNLKLDEIVNRIRRGWY